MSFRIILFSILTLATVNIANWSSALAATPPDPTYAPIYADDMESYTNGMTYPVWNSTWSSRSIISSEHAHSGTKSHRISFLDGTQYYGGDADLNQTAGAGDTIWYRAYFYFPSTLSFSGGDYSDFYGWGKFMLLDKLSHDTPRMYVQLPAARYSNYGDADFAKSGIAIISDNPISSCYYTSVGYTLPRDKWVALQVAWKLSYTDGWIRLWSDDTFIGECKSTIPSGYKVANWGIGNYWNGKSWVQGKSTAHFWMDDVVITKQTPNTKDSGGRPFIHPAHYAGDFLAAPMPPTIDPAP